MSLISRSADLVYTFRFLKLLVTDFEDTNAFKLGIIDENGKRIKSKRLSTSEEKSAYNTFHRLVFSVKRLIEKVPGGRTKLASYAAALFLIKEKYNMSDRQLRKILEASGIDAEDMLNESTEWFLLEDRMLSPGLYKVTNEKVLNTTFECVVNPGDKVKVPMDSYPVGNVFGIDIYEAIHQRTQQSVYISVGELVR